MAKHIHVHLHRGKAKDAVGKPYEPDEIDRNGKRWEKTEEMIPFNGKPARKYKEKGGYRYITREVESGTVHDAGFSKYDPREATRLDDEIKYLQRKIRKLEESGDFRHNKGEYENLKKDLADARRDRDQVHDAYRGTFTVEVDGDSYDAYVPGREINWMGTPAKVVKRVFNEKKWSGGRAGMGEFKPAHVMVTLETLDCKATDSKLEDLEKQLDEIETQIEKLEDSGQSPSRALLDKRRQIQGAIAVIKSAPKKAAE